MKKIGIVFLVCVLVVSLFPAAYAAEESPTLDIIGHNITFKDSVFLKYAVDAANVSTGDVQLLVWTEAQDDYSYGTQKAVLEPSGEKISGKDYIVFSFTGLTAKQMTDDVYVRAYAEKDGTKYYSEVDRYSILDYAYSMLGKTGTATTNTKLQNLLEVMLEYGAAAQEYYNGGEGYHLERLATDTFYQISVVDGYLDNGFTEHLYKAGESVTLTAVAEKDGNAFDHWENSAGASVGTAAGLTVTVGTANETYTAKYESATPAKPTPSEGLDISVEDSEAIIDGIGECEDTFIILPEEYDSVPVTTIANSAFAAEEFTSIYIPVSVTSIGNKAFKGCDIDDVYYEGTESQWDDIEMGTNNGPLTAATIHYSSYGPAPTTNHTVTFKDYNGEVLKTESIADGGDATPPENPTRAGYTFIRWSGDYTNVLADAVVTAEYAEGTGPMIVVGNMSAKAGETVKVPVYIYNNPGIAGATLTISCNSKLALEAIEVGSAFSELTCTKPGTLANPCNVLWDSQSEESSKNGDLLYITFLVSESATAGETLEVRCAYETGSIYNKDLNNINPTVHDGSVIVK